MINKHSSCSWQDTQGHPACVLPPAQAASVLPCWSLSASFCSCCAKLTSSRLLSMQLPRRAFPLGFTKAVGFMHKVVKWCRLLSVVPIGKEADAYEVLGVKTTATSGEIKKQYWRLSLLIHPDKCAHPRANDAFQAVSKVSKDLQVRPAACLHSHHHTLLCTWCCCLPLSSKAMEVQSKVM